jgi:paraquat-inducible protein A
MDNLKKIVICHLCQTPHKKRRLRPNEEARCVECDSLLYREYPDLFLRVFAFSLTGLIFFLLANVYPIVEIDLSGLHAGTTLIGAIEELFTKGYILISLFSVLVLVLFPLFIFVSLLLFSLLMSFGKFSHFAKEILILVSYMKKWSMLDIFFIAILVAMVKIYQYGSIHFDIAFWSMGIVVLVEIYLTRYIPLDTLWDRWEEHALS